MLFTLCSAFVRRSCCNQTSLRGVYGLYPCVTSRHDHGLIVGILIPVTRFSILPSWFISDVRSMLFSLLIYICLWSNHEVEKWPQHVPISATQWSEQPGPHTCICFVSWQRSSQYSSIDPSDRWRRQETNLHNSKLFDWLALGHPKPVLRFTISSEQAFGFPHGLPPVIIGLLPLSRGYFVWLKRLAAGQSSYPSIIAVIWMAGLV